MIVVDDIYKRYQTENGPGEWVLHGVSFTIPAKTNVGLVGRNGAGKSTLLRIIGGVDQPSRGRVERHCRVSWPLGFGGGLQGSLSGRQNAKFVCRIHGHDADIGDRIAEIEAFADIGEAFDKPVKSYSSGMQARLKFAISLAFDFDVYISDELTAVGDSAFKKKAREAFQKLTDRAGLIMVSHAEGTLKEFCQAGIWLHEGKAHWFDAIDDALTAYRESQPAAMTASAKASPAADKPVAVVAEKSKPKGKEAKASTAETPPQLLAGLRGAPQEVEAEEGRRLLRQAQRSGLRLMSAKQIERQGYRLNEGAVPVLKKRLPAPRKGYVAFYDLQRDCSRQEPAK